MKKISLIGAALVIAASAMAQEAVLKEAERAMKKEAPLSEVIKIINPAFTNPATAEQAFTYYIPGKAGYKEADNIMVMEQLGQADGPATAHKVQLLKDSYDYMMKALELDPVTDEKGKVKTKYTKDILNTVGGHYADYYNAGLVAFNDMRDYKLAYELWGVYTDLPSNPQFAKVIKNPGDTILCDIFFNRAIAAYQAKMPEEALQSFINAKDRGYSKETVYEYAISVAQEMGKDDVVLALAKEALPIYGKENPNYIGFIINDYVNKQDYDNALTTIDQAIENNPGIAQYYIIKGIILETQDKDPKAVYAQAVEAEPNNAKALYNYGRMFYNEAMNIYNDAPVDNAAFIKVFNEEFKPVMLKAVDLFEKATDADPDDNSSLKLLVNAYDLLNDQTNLDLTKQRLGM